MTEVLAVTERLILRDYRAEDLPLYVALSTDPEVMRYMGGPRSAAHCEAELAEISRQYADIGFGMLAVERKEDGAFLGICGFRSSNGTPTTSRSVGGCFSPIGVRAMRGKRRWSGATMPSAAISSG